MFVSPGLTRAGTLVHVPVPTRRACCVRRGDRFRATTSCSRPAFEFLFEFGSANVNPEIRISSYINVITSLMFWMGVVFQIPLVMFALARFGVVTPRWLARFRRIAIVPGRLWPLPSFTPTFDPVNQTLVAVPIIVLYELGIVLARFAYRLRRGPAPRGEPGRLRRLCGRLWFWRRRNEDPPGLAGLGALAARGKRKAAVLWTAAQPNRARCSRPAARYFSVVVPAFSSVVLSPRRVALPLDRGPELAYAFAKRPPRSQGRAWRQRPAGQSAE